MSETDWEERREFEERLMSGDSIPASDLKRLIEDADAGEKAEAVLHALEKALRSKLGIAVVDATTDDDGDDVRLELVKVEEDSP